MDEYRPVIVGLGYVGLPLAVEFAKKYPTIGFDINNARIDELKKNYDRTSEVTKEELAEAKLLTFTSEVNEAANANVFIITVPTPIDEACVPDLSLIKNASVVVGGLLKDGDLVIYESTVYPGATEEVCIPLLESVSGKILNEGFYVGYSPERINPGDKDHPLTSIVKVTSGSNDVAAKLVDTLYGSIIEAGTYLASSIRVAEAAKVIENTQRDLNIALMNELSKIFNVLGIDTKEVLEAASTKWNFIRFSPGLVGGHCIGVDPYYLTHKAVEVGYYPEVILAGRRINEGMPEYVANRLIKELFRRGHSGRDVHILVLGLTFKENCPDLRNSKAIELVKELCSSGVTVDVYDPFIEPNLELGEFNVLSKGELTMAKYSAIVLAVPHEELLEIGVPRIRMLGRADCIFYDLKSVFEKSESDLRS